MQPSYKGYIDFGCNEYRHASVPEVGHQMALHEPILVALLQERGQRKVQQSSSVTSVAASTRPLVAPAPSPSSSTPPRARLRGPRSVVHRDQNEDGDDGGNLHAVFLSAVNPTSPCQCFPLCIFLTPTPRNEPKKCWVKNWLLHQRKNSKSAAGMQASQVVRTLILMISFCAVELIDWREDARCTE